ncbi:hydroxymethylglutaryl-CoA lyase [Caldimonas tepidiphila]|uniref:hydroxymethylglutaryl-CoA lyase n=1 Tax=Caldimonas tepidiphila TaxID=2315841 RepID=UPI0013008F1F|nr:hydroxymethylglutaryl-CoA lyase [Caldimonas tepidiphila]
MLREVGLRDGLQSLRHALPTTVKCDWILLAHAAGLREIEVGSFVSSQQFPQMADTAEVIAFAKTIPELSVSVLVHDLDGARAALAAGADLLTLPLSASEAHSRANVGRTAGEMVEELHRVRCARDIEGSSARVEAGIGTAFGCALQGEVSPATVLGLVQAASDAGVDGVGLGDTFGFATPDATRDLLERARALLPDEVALGVHLHRTPGNHLGNVIAAVEAGVTRFDASLAGIGGSRVSAQGSGNVSIEDVAALFGTLGVDTGVDMRTLLELRDFVGAQPDARALFEAVSRAAARSRGGLFRP